METTVIPQYKKLDYTLKTAKERREFVDELLPTLTKEQLRSKKYIEILADYIVSAMTPEEKKEKLILTENRMITVNKRETSFQNLVDKFENGEDGLGNLMLEEGNKNILLTNKKEITEKDLKEIDALRDLKEAIKIVEEMEKTATGKKRYKLKKSLIEMHQEQYIIKDSYKPVIAGGNTIKNLTKTDLLEHITLDEKEEPVSDCLVSLFNPEHICALLCNYSALKEDCGGRFTGDFGYLMQDLDNLVEDTLKKKYPLYYKLVIYKIDGRSNAEIQELLDDEFGITYTVEYLSSLWRKKIPKMIAEKAKENYLLGYFTFQEKGKWKKCSRCGEIKLAHNRFFSKNNTSKDHFYSICKECRNKKERS